MSNNHKESKQVPTLSPEQGTRDKGTVSSGYPVYPPADDIYAQSEELVNADPEDPTVRKTGNEDAAEENEPDDFDFDEAIPGNDLDVPGSELDDEEEKIGSEDEENNYYSVGGDDHNALDEDNPDEDK